MPYPGYGRLGTNSLYHIPAYGWNEAAYASPLNLDRDLLGGMGSWYGGYGGLPSNQYYNSLLQSALWRQQADQGQDWLLGQGSMFDDYMGAYRLMGLGGWY